ncbi:MAG: alpha/beta fold hydrolase [Gemmatimonadota bacterium]
MFAQSPTGPTRDSLYNAYMNFPSLVRDGSVQAHWMQDGSSFWYAEGAPDRTIVYKVDPEANTRVVLIDPERFRQALTPLLGHEPPGRGLPFETFEFQDNEGAVKFTLEEKDFVLRLDTYEIIWFPTPEVDNAIPPAVPRFPDWPARLELPSPHGRWVLVVQNENLWLRSLPDGHTVQLTSDGDESYEWGGFGWQPPIWASWSPGDDQIVVKRVDWRGVPEIPIPCAADSTGDVRWLRYRSVDQPAHVTELHVLDVPNGRSVSIDLGNDPDSYVDILGWQADGSRVFFQRTNRWATRVELLAADPATGRTQLLFEQHSDVPFGAQFTVLADGRRFVRLSPGRWVSDFRGTARLYLHDMESESIRVLTPETVLAGSVIAVDEVSGWLYWTGRTRDPRADHHFYRVRLDGTGLVRLTEGVEWHEIQLAPSKRFFIDNHSSTARPPSAELRSVEGALLQILSTANIAALERLGWRPPEEFVVKAADGTTDNYGILYKPTDFDPETRYPVIELIYAHPCTRDAPRVFVENWPSYWQAQALAQLGFLVVIVDWRGSSGLGTPQAPIYGNIGRYEFLDHVAALQQLAARRPYMDLGRVGVYGQSYGGYTTLRAMLTAPDFYKVGIATSAITDLAEHPFNEVWTGPMETQREAYEYASNIPLAKDLRGKLLLIHGTCDSAVPLSHTMRLIEEFARTGRPYDLILLPGVGHDSFGSHEAYWLDAIRRYFVEHLKPDRTEAIMHMEELWLEDEGR